MTTHVICYNIVLDTMDQTKESVTIRVQSLCPSSVVMLQHQLKIKLEKHPLLMHAPSSMQIVPCAATLILLRSWVSQLKANINHTISCSEYNYRSLDAVFKTDCPVCSVNLKTMWCEYACNPTKARFRKWYLKSQQTLLTTIIIWLLVTDLGTKTTAGQLYRLVGFSIDSDYACGVFTSCKKVSYIAQAGISSSISFLLWCNWWCKSCQPHGF